MNGKTSQFCVACGERRSKSEKKGFVKTEFQSQLLNELLLSHSVGDFCVVGTYVTLTFLLLQVLTDDPKDPKAI